MGGQSYVMMTGNIEKILSKFKSMAELSDGDLNILPKTAYGCVNNLSCENGLCSRMFYASDYSQVPNKCPPHVNFSNFFQPPGPN